jgi:hypothetical protein
MNRLKSPKILLLEHQNVHQMVLPTWRQYLETFSTELTIMASGLKDCFLNEASVKKTGSCSQTQLIELHQPDYLHLFPVLRGILKNEVIVLNSSDHYGFKLRTHIQKQARTHHTQHNAKTSLWTYITNRLKRNPNRFFNVLYWLPADKLFLWLSYIFPKKRFILTFHNSPNYKNVQPLVERHNIWLCVLGDYIYNNAKTSYPENRQDKLLWITPTHVSQAHNQDAGLHPNISEHPLKLFIPGAVDFARRNYFMLVEALQELRPDERKRFQFIILGNHQTADGLILRKELKHHDLEKHFCFTLSGFLPTAEFNAAMSEADYILPLIDSQVGQRYFSQSFFSAMIYTLALHKPAILHEQLLKNYPLLQGTCLSHSDDSLAEALKQVANLAEHRSPSTTAQEIKEAQEHYQRLSIQNLARVIEKEL